MLPIPRRFFLQRSGFTLLETIVVIGILAILALLVVTVSERLPSNTERTKCMNNMRNIHTALAARLQDKNQWPQEPMGDNVTQDLLEDWWIQELSGYGITPETWRCPTIDRLVVRKSPTGRPKVHYTVASFDPHPFTPYKWKTQPWLVEIGNMHGRGALLIFSDGSIRPMDEVVETMAIPVPQ